MYRNVKVSEKSNVSVFRKVQVLFYYPDDGGSLENQYGRLHKGTSQRTAMNNLSFEGKVFKMLNTASLLICRLHFILIKLTVCRS